MLLRNCNYAVEDSKMHNYFYRAQIPPSTKAYYDEHSKISDYSGKNTVKRTIMLMKIVKLMIAMTNIIE